MTGIERPVYDVAISLGLLSKPEASRAGKRCLGERKRVADNRYLIVHADDLGLAKAFNEGVREAYTSGMLTSTSLRTNGPAFEEAVDSVIPACPDLGIGIHLNIVEGRSQRKRISRNSRICDRDGYYTATFGNLLQAYLLRKQSTFDEIEEDLRSQIETALSRGIRIDHLNSHEHSHAIPPIFRIVCKLAREFEIPYVRLAREKLYYIRTLAPHFRVWYTINVAKSIILNSMAWANARTARSYGVKTNNWFVGILYTGHMDSMAVLQGLRSIDNLTDNGKVAEVLLHPCRIVADENERYPDPGVRDYVINPARSQELSSLKDGALAEELHRRNWTFTCYSRLADPKRNLAGDCTERDDISASQVVDGGSMHSHRRPTAVPGVADSSTPPLRTFVIINETPFYHPEYLRRLAAECKDIDICGAALVELPGGGVLQKYLIKRWRVLGLREIVKLAANSFALRLAGRMPRVIRGNHEGSVRAVLTRYRIPYRTVSAVNNRDFLNYLQSFEPDLILSSNSLIFGQRLIDSARVACINRHSALLPTLGGILPVFRAVQLGLAHSGASVHYVTREIDGGAVLSRKWVPIFPKDTLQQLYRLCFVVSYEATVEAARMLRMSAQPECLSNDGLENSYFSYPEDQDWKEFRAHGGRFA